MYLKWLFGLLLVLFLNCGLALKNNVPRIAVIGAGVGGASTVHFLQSLFGESGVAIDIYEKHVIGGRIALSTVANQKYENGGSIIHEKNKYMSDFLKILGLRKRKTPWCRHGIYDGKRYVFVESKWSALTLLDMFWQYGFQLFKVDSMINDLLNDFSRIYSFQDNGYTFGTVEALLTAMNPRFVNMTQITARSYLKHQQMSDDFIDELFSAVTRTNYGQTPDMSGFAGAVALAGVGATLWAVKGGNRLIPELLINQSTALVVPAKVVSIQLQNKQFLVEFEKKDHHNQNDISSTGSDLKSRLVYDMVVIAAPLTKDTSKISFNGFSRPIHRFEGRYHHTVCTLVRGEVNRTYFNMTVNLDAVLTSSTGTNFNSLSLLYPVDEEKPAAKVWKIFSQVPLTETELSSMFTKRHETRVTDWLAYPHYTPPENLGPFELYPGLFHVNSIEWAASAMEMSAISGRNSALLAYKYWNGIKGKHDTVF